MSLNTSEVVDGKYRVLERLGAGGMGEVYKVEHVFLRATRVIKVIRPQVSQSADAHDRFLREAQLATKVQHPNVATLHDFSALPDGSHYMVWEYIEGENLAQVIKRRGTLPPAEAIRIAMQALAGLEAIHRAGIIHRDISPENLMVTKDGAVKIIDLGVAKAEQGDYAATQTGMFVGKFRYSSPEQLGFLPEGEKIDSRADLYSLGVVLFEMLTGRPPIEATSPHEYFLHHSGATNVQPLDLTRVPNLLRHVLSKALDRDRNRRYATAKEFSDALDGVQLRLPTQEDETLRVTPLPGTVRTVRTERAAVPTEISPTPQKPKQQTGLLIAVALLVVVIVLGGLGLLAWRYLLRPAASAATVVTNTIAAPKERQAPSSSTVQVTTEAPTVTPAPATVPVPAPVPEPVTPKKVVPAPQPPTTTTHAPPPPPVEHAEASDDVVPSFVESGSSSRNDAAIASARERLHGVARVSLDARGDSDLIEQVRNTLQRLNLNVVDGADVTIRFYGAVSHLRFGRKKRAAEATILKNGRPIFRYEMKSEEYRVGDNPAEAFARVLNDLFR